jgi:hypothetical protein
MEQQFFIVISLVTSVNIKFLDKLHYLLLILLNVYVTDLDSLVLLPFQFGLLQDLTMNLFESLISSSCSSDDISPILDGLQVLVTETRAEFSQQNKLVSLKNVMYKDICK